MIQYIVDQLYLRYDSTFIFSIGGWEAMTCTGSTELLDWLFLASKGKASLPTTICRWVLVSVHVDFKLRAFLALGWALTTTYRICDTASRRE